MMTDPGMKRKTNPGFLRKAAEAEVRLSKKTVRPLGLVKIVKEDGKGFARAVQAGNIQDLREKTLGRGDRVCLDFGGHYAGYLSIRLVAAGSHQDAPAFLRLKFAEIPQEIMEDSASYDGWISRGWIQEEWLHLDTLPQESPEGKDEGWLHLPRRYAFRYLEILVLDTSQKYRISIADTVLTAVSSASEQNARPLSHLPADLQRIDRIALTTLRDCMQKVFEDGPKRDQRLWLGDLRLEAKTDYATFHDTELVKRCLYLFAGSTRDDGKIAACLFTEPEAVCDDTFLWDYSLFFVSVLYDYYMETGDEETLHDLWPPAYRQIELALADMEDGVLKESSEVITAFIDWMEGLDRQAASQGVWIYVLRQASKLATISGTPEQSARIQKLLDEALQKAEAVFWDEEKRYFVSGSSRKASKITQAWMVIADAVTGEEARDLILRAVDDEGLLGVMTPYAYHSLVEAVLHVASNIQDTREAASMKEKALGMIRSYWGKMADLGADTFWEAFDPEDPYASPYGNMQVNSFCHAWSCTPAWLLREFW